MRYVEQFQLQSVCFWICELVVRGEILKIAVERVSMSYMKTKIEKRHKLWICMVCSLFLIGLFVEAHTVAAETPEEFGKTPGFEKQAEDEMYIPEDTVFTNDSEVRYFAYMNLNGADESLKSKILQARNIVISNSSWVADGITGYVKDRDTGTITLLPHFSEIFPSDWEIPVYPPHDAEQSIKN